MDQCYFCSGKVVTQRIDHLHRWGHALLLVKGLQADVCQECKKVYLPLDSLDGETLAVVSLREDQLRPIGRREIAHARPVQVA